MQQHRFKIIALATILVVGVVSDQLTKQWAETALASPRYPEHRIELTLGPQSDGKTVREALALELPSTPADELDVTAARFVRRGGEFVGPNTTVREGDVLSLGQRSIRVIDGYWDFIYARNPGAAWSFLADAPEGFRKAFFIGTSILAILLMGVFLYRAEPHQKGLMLALSGVLAGAIGNLIDRFRFGYVIDFIAWHYHDAYWPTFNIADAFITVGVALMAIELLFGGKKKEPAGIEGDKAKADGAKADKVKADKVKANKAKADEPEPDDKAKA